MDLHPIQPSPGPAARPVVITSVPTPSLPADLQVEPIQPAEAPAQGSPAAVKAAVPATKPAAAKPLRWAFLVDDTVTPDLQQHASQLDVIAPAWFHANPDGTLYGDNSPEVMQFARAHGLKVVPIVTNGEFDESAAWPILNDGSVQTNFLNSLQALIQQYGYDGINIDFENLAPDDRTNFSAMMSNVYARLHPLGKMVTVDVGAKTSEDLYDGFAAPYDYHGLAPNIDLAIIMAYDEHYSGGDPGPVADVAWVQDAVNYATSQIPASKVMLGIPFYGYDWGPWGGEAVTYQDVVQTVFAEGAQIHLNQAAESPTFSYPGHEVWFEDSTSLKAKLGLVSGHNLGGWAAWRLGQEDPNFWSLSLNGH